MGVSGARGLPPASSCPSCTHAALSLPGLAVHLLWEASSLALYLPRLLACPRSQVHQLELYPQHMPIHALSASSLAGLPWSPGGWAVHTWEHPQVSAEQYTSACPPLPGHRDAGVGPTALSWFRRWLRASPTTPSHADVLEIYTDAQGGVCLPLEPGLGRPGGRAVWRTFPGL